jgi:putative membrane protein
VAVWLGVACAGALYAGGARVLRARRRPWSPWRTLSFAAGLAAVAAALAPPVAAHDEHFAVHMLQHTLLGMFGPLLLALSAPVSLALRTLPRQLRAGLVALLHARATRLIAHPLAATTLSVGGLAALYLTPLYDESLGRPVLHALVHLHLLASGCLFTWVFVGLDPVPRRGSTAFRLALLVLALGAHAALAKLVYGGFSHVESAAVAELHRGAKLMYYGGDLFDLAILAAFFRPGYVAGGRRLRARSASAPGVRR